MKFDFDWEKNAVKYLVGYLEDSGIPAYQNCKKPEFYIVKKSDPDWELMKKKEVKWAIVASFNHEFSKKEKDFCEVNLLASEKDDDFFDEFRFDTKEEALEAFWEWKEKNKKNIEKNNDYLETS